MGNETLVADRILDREGAYSEIRRAVNTGSLSSYARLGQPRAAVPTRDPWLGAYASCVTVGAVYCGHVAEIDRVFEVEAGD
jgi:hypothetical protein